MVSKEGTQSQGLQERWGSDDPVVSPPHPTAPLGERSYEEIDHLVDRVVDSHRAVMATLSQDVHLSQGSQVSSSPVRTGFSRLGPVLTEEESLQPHAGVVKRERRQRAHAAAALRPLPSAVHLDPPLVTRGGVLYVPPSFEQARALDGEVAHRLVMAGYRSVEAFLHAPEQDLCALTGLSVLSLRRAKRDLDLMRLPQVDEKCADLLRLVGCASVSRLAGLDPGFLARDVERMVKKHRFLRVPNVLADETSIRRLVAAAKARSE